MNASVDSGGRSRSQHSQLGRSWSMSSRPSAFALVLARSALGEQLRQTVKDSCAVLERLKLSPGRPELAGQGLSTLPERGIVEQKEL